LLFLRAAPGAPAEPPPADGPDLTARLSIGGAGEGWLVTRSGGQECTTPLVLKTPDDVPALLRLIPRGARLREVFSLAQTPPKLLAALLPRHPEIEFLGLGGDRLGDEDLKHLAGLGQLRGLHLGTPRVTADGLAVLSRLRRLQDVHFFDGRTPVTDGGLKALRGLRDLRSLGLNGTRITDAGLAQLRHLDRLETLRVSRTRVGRPGQWPDMPALADLWLSHTGVRDEDLPHLARYPRLRRLDLDSTPLAGKTLAPLAKLGRLEQLSLADTPVADDAVAPLAGLPKLWSLHLGRTRVTDGVLPHLARLTELRVLNLEGTQATEAGVAKFSREHPRVYVCANAGSFIGGKRHVIPEERDDDRRPPRPLPAPP
jgi:hypothetical protein